MNHIYKVVFNKATGAFTAVAEFARSQGKNSTVNNSSADTSVSAGVVKFGKITPLAAAVLAALGFGFASNAHAAGLVGSQYDKGSYSTVVIGGQADANAPAYAYDDTVSEGNKQFTTSSHNSLAIGGNSDASNTWYGSALGYGATVASSKSTQTTITQTWGTVTNPPSYTVANSSGSNRGNVALGAFSAAGDTNTGAETKSIKIGDKTYNYAGQPTDKTSVLAIGSGKEVQAVPDGTDGIRVATNNGMFNDKTASTDEFKYRQIQYVAAGRVAEDSTDGVNGSQLYQAFKAIEDVANNAGGAAKQNYFHVNATNQDKSSDPTANATNLAAVDGIGGAKAAYSLAAGVNAQALSNNTIAIGKDAGVGFVDPQGTRQHIVNGQIQAASSTIATNTNVVIGDNAGTNATGRNQVIIGNNAGDQYFGDDSVSIGTNANNYSNQTAADGTVIGTDKLVRGRYAVAVGRDARTWADHSIAIGDGATVSSLKVGSQYTNADRAMAVGAAAKAQGQEAIAVGNEATASRLQSVAIGKGAKVEASSVADQANGLGGNIAMGTNALIANTARENNMAIGEQAKVLGGGSRSMAVGSQAVVTGGNRNSAVGGGAKTHGDTTSAYGSATQVRGGYDAMAFGSRSATNGDGTNYSNQVAVGSGAITGAKSATAVGSGVMSFGKNSTAIGATGGGSENRMEDALKDGKMTDTTFSIIGGTNNTAIGNANLVGSSSKNNFVFGNNIKVGATSATVKVEQENVTAPNGTVVQYDKYTPTFNGEKAVEQAIAIGQAAAVSANNTIAIGSGATASETEAVAIGSANQSTAKRANTVGANNLVAGANASAYGNNNFINSTSASSAIIGNHNQLGGQKSYNASTNDMRLSSATSQPDDSTVGSFVIGNNNRVTSENTFILGSGINTMGDINGRPTSYQNGTIANSVYLGAESYGVFSKEGKGQAAPLLNADGSGTEFQIVPNSFDTGETTTAGSYDYKNATVDYYNAAGNKVGTLTYGGEGFAGSAPVGIVTIGASGYERRLQNVAAGEISRTSTDAINGSQLFAVAEKVSAGWGLQQDGEHKDQVVPADIVNFTKGNGTTVEITTDGTTSKVKFDVAVDGTTVQIKDGKLTATSKDTSASVTAGSTAVTVEKGTASTVNGVEVTDYKVDLSQGSKESLAKADTALQSFTTSVNGTQVETIDQANNDVNFVNGNATTARADGQNITFDVKTDGTTIKVEGNKIVANTTPVTVRADGKVNTPANTNALVTAGDVANAINNSGWNLAATGTQGTELINPSDTVTFSAGNNLEVERSGSTILYKLSDDINVNSVQLGDAKTGPVLSNDGDNIKVGSPDGSPVKITNLAEGTDDKDAVNVSQLNKAAAAARTKVEAGKNTTVDKTTGANQEDVYTVNAWDTKATAGSTALTVTSTADASNDTNKTRDYVIDLSQATKDQLAKEESVIGEGNITVAENGTNSTGGKEYKVTLNKDVNLGNDGSLTIGDTKLDGNNLTVGGNNPVTIDGNKGTVGGLTNTSWDPANITTGQAATEDQLKTAAAAAKTEVKAGENVTVTSVEGDDKQTIYTVNAKDTSAKVTGSDKVVVTKGATAKEGTVEVTDYQVDLSQGAKDSLAKADTALQSFTTSVNGSQVETINQTNNDVNFVNGNATSARASGSDITFDINTDGTTIKVDGNKIAANTTPVTVGTDGKVTTPANTNALVTAGDVAKAINNSGFTLKSSANGGEKVSGDDEVINPGDVVDMAAGKNLTVEQAASGKITYSLAKDVDLGDDGSLSIGNSELTTDGLTTPKVNFGPVGDKNAPSISSNDAGDLVVGKPDGSPVKITNLKAGTADTDAVNVSQLNKAAAAAKTEVKDGKNTTVRSTTGDKDQTIYQVDAWDTKVAAGSALSVTPNDNEDAKTREYTIDLSDETKAQLAKEESVDGDSNITVTQDKLNSTKGKNFNVSLNKDINLTDTGSLTIGDTVVNTNGISTGNTAMTPDGIVINGGPAITHDNQGNFKLGDINSGEPVKITNLKAGEADNDAVNVSQLKAAQAAATTKVVGDKGVTVTPETNKDGSTTYTVAAKTDGTTVKVDDKGNIAAVTSDITTSEEGSSTATTPSSLVTAGDVAKAINNSGWKLAADGTAGTELINPADTVTFKAKDNLNVSRDGANITYGLNKDVDLTKDGSLTIGETALTKDGLIINNGPMLVSNGNNLKVGSVDGNTAAPIQIQNVDSGLKDDKGNVVTLADATGDVLNNVVNVGDLKSASDNLNKDLTEKGFNITADNSALDNNATTDNVNLGQTVKFTDPDKNIVTTVADNEIRFGLSDQISVGGKDGKDGKDGQVSLTVEKASPALDGKDGQDGEDGQTRIVYEKPNGEKEEVATLNDGLNFVGDDGQVIKKKLNEQLDIIGGADKASLTDNNIGVNYDNGKLKVQLTKDINLTDTGSLTIGDTVVNTNGISTGNTAMTPDGIVINGGPAITHDNQGNFKLGDINTGEPVKITNLKAGEADNDAVNVSQLKAAQAAATTKVEGDKGVTVTPETNKDGSTTYTVAAKTDGTTVKVDDKGNIAAVTSDITTNTDGSSTATTPSSLVTAGDVAKAINNSGWNLAAEGTDGKELINPADTVTFKAKDNLNVSRDGANITYGLNKDVDLTKDGSLRIGDTALTKDGLIINNGPMLVSNGNNLKVGSVDGDTVSPIQIQNVDSGLKDPVTGDKVELAKATGDVLNNVVNVGDLKSASDNLNKDLTEKGFNITADNSALDNNATTDNVNLGQTVKFTDPDKNIVTTVADNEIRFGLSDQISVGGKDGKDGQIGVKGKDGKDGLTLTPDAIVFNGVDGKDGKDGQVSLTVEKASPALDGKDGQDGEDGQTRIVYEKPNGEKEEVATLNDGLIFTGNNSDTLNRHKLNSLVTIEGEGVDKEAAKTFKSAAGNINVEANGTDKLTVKLNKDIDLTKDGSLRIGDTALTKDGLIINNGPMLVSNGNNLKVGSVDGDTVSPIQIQNVDSGLKDPVTGDKVELAKATGDVLNNVVNVGDLKSASDNLNKDLTEKGFNITADNSALDNNATTDNVNLGQTVKFTDPDKNIVTTVADNEIRFGLSDQISVGGKDGKDGQIGVKGKDGKDGLTLTPDAIVFNGVDGKDGKDGQVSLTVEKASPALDGKDGQDGEDGQTRIVYEKPNGEKEEVATLNDGLNFVGDDGQVIKKKLNEQLDIIGGADKASLTDNNIGVNYDNGKLKVQLTKDINLTDTGSLTIGDTVVNTNGISTGNTAMTPDGIVINGGPAITHDNQGNFKLGDINTGEPVKITNLKAGEADNDAVNVSQLKAAQAAATTKVEGDKGVTVTPETNKDGSTTYTVAAKTDGTTVKVDDKGNIAAVTSDITTNTDGSSTATTPSSLVTAGDVAKAINNSGWKLAADGTAGTELINPSDTVTFKAVDNLNVSRDGANITYGLNKDVDLTKEGSLTIGDTKLDGNSLKVGGNNPVTIDGNKGTVGGLTNTSWDPANITTGQAATEDQLKQAAAAATTKVVEGDNITVTPTNNADGSTTYKVETKRDVNFDTVSFGPKDATNNPTISNDGNGNIKVGSPTGEPVKITNLKAGEADNDAVNVSQLKAAQAAATTKVEGDKGVTVTPETNKDGSTTYTVAAKTDGTTVKVDGNGNIAAVTAPISTEGNKAKTNGADNLATAGDVVNAINNSGFTLKSSVNGGTKVSGDDEVINPGDTVEMIAGKNLTVTQEANGKITFATKDELTADNIQVGEKGEPGKDGKDGTIGVNGKDGSAVVINGKDGSIGLNGKDGENGLTLKGADGAQGVDGTNGANGLPGKDGTTRLVYETKDPQDPTKTVTQEVANLNDGLIFTGNNSDTLNRHKLNSLVTIEGEGVDKEAAKTFESAAGNINVVADGSNKLTVQLNKDVKVDSVTANTVNVGTGANQVALTSSVAQDGTTELSVGTVQTPTRITNVASGVNATDAVNMSQLQGAAQAINNRIGDVANDANAGVSSAMAMAALPQAYLPGKSMLTGGIASYNGQGAVAVGFSKLSDNGRWVLKVQGSADTQGNAGGAVGAGFHF